MGDLEIITICCIPLCGKIKVDDNNWKYENEVIKYHPGLYIKYLAAKEHKLLSHGYCPSCKEIILNELGNE